MRTAEVVYVPVPENSEDETKDEAVQSTFSFLVENGFVMGATTKVSNDYGDTIRMRVFTRK